MEEKNLILEEIEKNKDKISKNENIIIDCLGNFKIYVSDLNRLNNTKLKKYGNKIKLQFKNLGDYKKIFGKIPSFITEITLEYLEELTFISYSGRINIKSIYGESYDKKDIIITGGYIGELYIDGSSLEIEDSGVVFIKNNFINLKINNVNINKIDIRSCEFESISTNGAFVKDFYAIQVTINFLSICKLKGESFVIAQSDINYINFLNSEIKKYGFYLTNNETSEGVANFEYTAKYEGNLNDIIEYIFDKNNLSLNIFSGSNYNSPLFIINLKNTVLEANRMVSINNINIKKLCLNELLISNNTLKLNELDINKLSLSYVNLGKSIISNTKIENLELKNPVLNETIFNNVEFPKNDIKIAGEENSTNYGEIKEYYIQLKNVMDNSGNHIQADKFFAKEMEYYGKSLKGEKGQFWNKLVYYIQKGISDFGNDWTLPVLWMINLGNLFLIIDYYSKDYKIISDFHLILYFKNLYRYLNDLANAIKPLDILNVTSDITFFGLLYKITLAVLIYHLIISLKRLTKR